MMCDSFDNRPAPEFAALETIVRRLVLDVGTQVAGDACVPDYIADIRRSCAGVIESWEISGEDGEDYRTAVLAFLGRVLSTE